MIDLNTPKYKLWDRQSAIVTPSGNTFSAEAWIVKYPWARKNPAVISGDPVFNGGFMAPLVTLQRDAASKGCDFEGCEDDQSVLDRILNFIKDEEQKSKNATSSSDRIASAIEEYTAVMTLAELSKIEDNLLQDDNDEVTDFEDNVEVEDFEKTIEDEIENGNTDDEDNGVSDDDILSDLEGELSLDDEE